MVTQSDVFHAVSDATRRAILDQLSAGDRQAGDIAQSFPISRPAISKHLRVLREASLVSERQEGRNRVYHLNAERLREVDVWLENYRRLWNANLASLKFHVEAQGRSK